MRWSRSSLPRLLALVVIILWATPAWSTTYRLTPADDWFDRLSGSALQPGDVVVLAAGTYSDPRRLVLGCRGRAGAPIRIEGAPGARVVFQRPDARQNTINMEGTQYVELRNLEITGGSSGIRIGPAGDVQASHIVLEGLHIHHTGGVAVTCNHDGGDYDQMRFRLNHIHHTSGHGEGFYLGGNHASAVFHDSVVELNYIHDLQGANVSQGDGIEIKPGGYNNLVRGNVLHDTGYPGIIVYGSGGRAPNRIENNLVLRSGDQGIQAAADAQIRNNVVFASANSGIYSRAHQGVVPGNLEIVGNWIIASGRSAIRVAGEVAAPVELRDNWLFPSRGQLAVQTDAPAWLKLHGNRGRGEAGGGGWSDDQWSGAAAPPRGIPLVQDTSLDDNPAWEHLDRAAIQRLLLEAL